MAKQNLSHLASGDDGSLFDPTSGHTHTLNSVGTFRFIKMIEGIGKYFAPAYQTILPDIDEENVELAI